MSVLVPRQIVVSCRRRAPVRVLGSGLWNRMGLIWRHQSHLSTGASATTSFYNGEARERQKGSTRRFPPKEGRAMWKECQLKQAVQMLETREHQGDQGHCNVYARLLQECAKTRSLTEGKQVHEHMLRNQITPDIFLGNTLISMYAKCGSMVDAHKVFQSMPEKDIISWNAIIAGFAQHRQGQEAVDHFRQMQRERLKPNRNTFLSILSACVTPVALELGKQIHSRLIKARYESDVTVGSALISMYSKCGSVDDARKVFDTMSERNVVSWTAMIAGYVQQGHSKEAFRMFRKLQKAGVKPNEITFMSILGACASLEDLEQGKQIHSYIKEAGLEQEVLIGNALVSMYARCGSITDARQVFDSMIRPDLISWNAMIAGYAEDGRMGESFELFRRMQKKGHVPDRFTYTSLLGLCANQAALEQGKRLHAQILNSGCESHVSVGTALISMYTKCGSLADAFKVFDKMPQRNVVSWNAIIAGCSQHGPEKEPFKLFRQMQQDGVNPDHVTFITLLNACRGPETLEEGRIVHRNIVQWRLLLNNSVANSLVSMYSRCGSLEDAREVFYRIKKRDLSSWNAMIAAYIQHSRNEEALELFKKFQREGGKCDKFTFISGLRAIANVGDLEMGRRLHGVLERKRLGEDIHVMTTLISMYSKCGSLVDACNVFKQIPERDVVCWNAMVAACAHNGHGKEALNLYAEMQVEGVKPNKATLTSVLSACASLGALEHGQRIHSQIKEAGVESDIPVSNALIEMYSKCGSLSHADEVFNKMPTPDVNSWNAIIAGYSQHGQGKGALQYYEHMQRAGMKPNKATFISVLSACCQLGQVDEGFDFLESMNEEWSLEPAEEHYAGMVEILGRAGLLEEAEEFIEEIPVEPEAAVWEALLIASRVHHNVDLAESVAERLLDADLETSSAVCEQLLSIYAAAGRWEDMAVLKGAMEEKGLKEQTSCTIEVNNELHTFVTDIRTHLQRSEIYAKLKEVAKKMRDAGFVPESQRDAHQQGREDSLCDHTELLAASFSLINTPPGTPIRFVTNVRMSDFSHKVAKFMSETYSSDIFVRDANRFHNFRNGVCSCGNYW